MDVFSVLLECTLVMGMAYCEWCRETIKYGSSGKKDIKKHGSYRKHKKIRAEKRSTPALPTAFQATRAMMEGSASEPGPTAGGGGGGGGVGVDGLPNCGPATNPAPPAPPRPSPIVPIADRKAHLESL
jgi:hypothetical protein